MKNVNVAIIGASGYSGVELIRLLLNHPYVKITCLISSSHNELSISDVYPHLKDITTLTLEELNINRLAEEVDLVFFATPSGISRTFIPVLVTKGLSCIDISGDFRLTEQQVYQKWYKHTAAPQECLDQAVYGLSEFFQEEIAQAKLIANPGCYPTATLLGLIPSIQQRWLDPHSIIIDGKSGVSGAGRGISLGTHFAEVNENIKAYKLGTHQHIPEIEQILSAFTQSPLNVTFSTHLIPMTRGIMCTIYANLLEDIDVNEVIQHYKEVYRESPFVRIRSVGEWPTTKEVYGSNYCDIGFMVDQRTKRLTIISVIDNVVKGAAGQAVQNMNIMHGWNQMTGLAFSPIYP